MNLKPGWYTDSVYIYIYGYIVCVSCLQVEYSNDKQFSYQFSQNPLSTCTSALGESQALREYNTKYAFDPEGGKKGGVESIDEAWAKSEKFETVEEGQIKESSWRFWACLIHISLCSSGSIFQVGWIEATNYVV